MLMLKRLRQLFDIVSKNSNLESIIKKILSSGYYALANDPQNKLAFLEDQSLSKEDQVKKLLSFLEEEDNEVDHEEALEQYLQTWKRNHQGRCEDTGPIEEEIMKIRTEHKRAMETNKAAVENLMESLLKNFKPLENKLVFVRAGNKASKTLPYIFVALAAPQLILPVAAYGVAHAFGLTGTKRDELARDGYSARNDNPAWFKNTEAFLVEYIRGEKSEDCLREFLQYEKLEEDFHHFQDCVCPWAQDLNQKIEITHFRPLLIASVEAELNRMEKFVFALVLNDPKYLKEHQELITDVMKTTKNLSKEESRSIFPSISFGQLPLQNGNKERVIRLRFALDQSYSHQKLKSFLESKFEHIIRSEEELINNQCIIVLDVVFEGSDSEFVAKHIAVLSDLSIRGILIGSFGLGIGDGAKSSDQEFRHCMNPSYNRIYSQNGTEIAEGFIPTSFPVSLNRGGEPYYCPAGWRRYGIDVGMTSSQFEAAYGEWPVAYHGTAGHLAWTILLAGLQASGTGCFLKTGEGCVYLSPSIEYCGHPRYSTVWKIKNQYVQMVLQVRVKKQLIFDKKPETLLNQDSKETVIDSNFKDNKEMEWLIRWPPGKKITSLDGLLVYGLMLRVTDNDPRKLNQCSWWLHSGGVPSTFD
jgi:hypothetical protein